MSDSTPTGHATRQVDLGEFGRYDPDLSVLSETEREVYEAVVQGDYGAREFRREKGWSSPGTVSNLLRRARQKLDDT